MKTLICATAAVILVGCSSVLMEAPLPDSNLTAEEMEALQGTWQLDNKVFYLHFSTNGLPAMASVEWGKNQHTLIQHNVHIAKRNDDYFLSLQNQPGEEPEGHLFAAFKPRNQEIVVWGPDVEFFEKQIGAEKLKGSVRKEGSATEIVLSSPPARILDLISTNTAAIDYEEPIIFRKLD